MAEKIRSEKSCSPECCTDAGRVGVTAVGTHIVLQIFMAASFNICNKNTFRSPIRAFKHTRLRCSDSSRK